MRCLKNRTFCTWFLLSWTDDFFTLICNMEVLCELDQAKETPSQFCPLVSNIIFTSCLGPFIRSIKKCLSILKDSVRWIIIWSGYLKGPIFRHLAISLRPIDFTFFPLESIRDIHSFNSSHLVDGLQFSFVRFQVIEFSFKQLLIQFFCKICPFYPHAIFSNKVNFRRMARLQFFNCFFSVFDP